MAKRAAAPASDEPASAPAASRAARRGRRRPTAGGWTLRIAWLLLLAVVLAGAGWAAWQLIGTNQSSANLARVAVEGYQAACAADPGAEPETPAEEPAEGDTAQVIGLLSFPQQSEQSWPIMVGTGEDQLATGIGWYPQTAGVGEIGNMALVGYRLTNGEPFADLLELRVGDQVRITTCTHVYIYEIEVAPSELTVQAGDDWVLQAVPGEPGQQPTGRTITLITSQDLLPSDDRSVGFGALVSAEPR